MANNGFTRRGALVAATGAAAATAACGSQSVETPAYSGNVAFNHGVASGDPQSDKVIIWTRVTPEQAGPVPVRWIVARDRELTDVVKSGVIQATDARDYTVKADVTGLRPGAPYFYGFRAGQAHSTTGKTKTLPRGRLDQLKLAVVSCASYPHGFFNAYEAIAHRDDVDVVVHLGDYIYEYGLSGYGGDTAISLGRIPAPQVECIRLADYRQRHAQYKGEAELQAAHAAAPWITVWDDHEVANDDWTGGAENHQPNEGAWADRKRSALQAYYEWMPIREPEPGRAFESINRSFQFGDLFTLIMLETRLLARSKQLDYATDMPIATQRWDFSDPRAPVALRQGEPDGGHMRQLPAIYEDIDGSMQPVLDWRRAGPMLQDAHNLPRNFYLAPDVAEISRRLSAPDRQLMGAAQEQWLVDQLAASTSAQCVWQVIGNQVVMAPVMAPDLSQTPPQLQAALERVRPGTTQLLKLTRFPFPANTDQWDGYPASRARVLEAFRHNNGNAIVVSGDSHAAWASELNDAHGRVGVEFAGTSITSPGQAAYFPGMDFGALIRARNPHIKWTDQTDHGFILLTLTKTQAKAEYFVVSTILTKQYETRVAASFIVAPNSGQGVGAITPAHA
ncbi:MAG: alkaline phosphatase D family protein [Proteobacteria bacterium]|nr:alkaline phosphatase D family protein [Pseudomonadota bacterium]